MGCQLRAWENCGDAVAAERCQPYTLDQEGRTPFWWAVKDRHVDVGVMLLEPSNIDPNTADEGGRTLILWAAEEGEAGVVEMLLKRKDVNPDTVDKSGRTPLSWLPGTGTGKL